MLRFTSTIGVIISILSFLLISTLVINLFFIGKEFQAGWPSLILAVSFFGGLNMFVLGIVGEYLIRMFMVVEKRPPYLVRERIGYD